MGDEKVRVCKTKFLNTFDLGERSVRSWILKSPLNNSEASDENTVDNLEPINESANLKLPSSKDTEKRNEIRQFLESLPKMESHYCQVSSALKYLEPIWESKQQLFREYQRACIEKVIEPASKTLFNTVFKTAGIGFYLPKKDQCETCLKYKLSKITAEEYNSHQKIKENSRKEKECDKKKAEDSNSLSVCCRCSKSFDLPGY